MGDDISSGTNVPNTDISEDTSGADLNSWVDESNHQFSFDFLNWSPPCWKDEQWSQLNLEGPSTSKLDLDWGYICDTQARNNYTHGNYGSGVGVYSSSECWSIASEVQSQTSVQGSDTGITQYIEGKAEYESILKSVLGPSADNKDVDDSNIMCILTDNILPLPSNNDEVDENPFVYESDDLQSESTINLRDETCEMNFQVPELGMMFSSQEEALKFYINYATKIGFKVRKGKTQLSADRKTIRKRYLFCSKQGFRSENKSDKTRKYKRKETRTGCNAMVQFTHHNDSGKWEITRVLLEHNHGTGGPNQMHTTCPSSNVSEEGARISTTGKSGVVKETGVAKSSGFPFVDSSNYLCIEKINILPPQDGQSLVNFLKHLQLKDPSFFYTVQLDAQSRLINFFWRDSRSKIDYEYFGDVLILDTTCRIDKYDIICAPFLGLNHHQQYVLFGCAFLLDDSKESFVWLFTTFVEAMGQRQPKTVFTDEHQAVSDAIEVVLPKTHHRFGMWYISQNARKHLSAYFGQRCFEETFNKCIFGCNSEKELHFMWDALVRMYNLQDNSWLNNLYKIRKKWFHVFCKGTYSAGIESLQGFENITNVFHSLRSKTIPLPKFVQQFLRAAEQRRREELYEDFHCNETERPMILKSSALEKQAADVYTSKMFNLFQEELHGYLTLAVKETANNGRVSMFELTDKDHQGNFVQFDCSEFKVRCSCVKFESIGILCAHALKVLDAKNIVPIPSQYILKRWTKSAKEGMVVGDCTQEITDESQGQSSSYSSILMHKALNVITKSAAVEGTQKIVEIYLDMALKDVEHLLKTEMTGHLNGKDAEIHYRGGDSDGTDGMETQTKVLHPPCSSPQELSKQSIDVRLKRRRE